MLNGKVALVTGTTSWDLGSMIALALAKNGADIALNLSPADPNRAEILKPRLSELCQTICDMGQEATLSTTQTIDSDAVKTMVTEISSKYRSVDILVNNGGYGLTISDIAKTPLIKSDRLKIGRREMLSAINCIAECLPLMIDNRWGRVINIGFSSILDFMRRSHELVQITGGKFLEEIHNEVNFPRPHLFSGLAQVLFSHERIIDQRRQNITINSVGLGDNDGEHWEDVYDTLDGFQKALTIREDTLKQSYGEHCAPQDIAEAVLFLCSERARFITDAEIRFSSE
jgi:3-oxoacyl-[acyl-carrier protein] reductase